MYRFLIYISYSYALPIGQPLVDEITSRGYEVKWFADEDEGRKGLLTKPNVLNTVEEVLKYNPHIVLTISDIVADFIPGLKVQIFHGFLTKKRMDRNQLFDHFRIRGFFDLYCTQGPSTTSVFKKLADKYGSFEVAETGWSKVDPLFPLEKIPPKNKPVILISSTFTVKVSMAYNDSVFNEIKRLSNTGKYDFLMVLHPKIYIETREKWKSLNNENFNFYDTTDLVPLFKKSDIMFSDNTSAIQEFLLQAKPVVVFNHTVNNDYLIHVHESQNIENAFKTALEYPENVISKTKEFISNLHPYFDGKSSKRVIDASIAQLHKDKSHLKNKPLNLIRKFKIRKRLKFFTTNTYDKPLTLKKEEII
ncbi:CDP-Glycerol:Poly(glycerophosphate) glycerophosphotransferase [Flavobacteriaceae bacterium MAR_2010_188]|nr:CDP-Glycerol:Poly(glycerophosphate) glycerophosphotransferase [Flavobacteriaceae bacterium MAR_2010_188]